MSVVRAGQAGEQSEPSPSIWKDCPRTLLTDLGEGFFVHEEFLGATVDTLATGEQRPNYGDLSIDADDDTVVSFKSGEQGGFLDVETDGDDNDAVALFTQPFAQVGLFGEQKVWFEVAIELGDITMDGGLFVGYVEEAGLTRDVVADGAAALVTESLFGFQILTDDPDAVDAVFRLDGGTVVEILEDVTNSAVLGTAAASLVNDTQVKLGMKFDGKDRLLTFVNGIQVAQTTLVGTTFPDNVLMGGIVAIKTGAAAAESYAKDWIRFAHQLRR